MLRILSNTIGGGFPFRNHRQHTPNTFFHLGIHVCIYVYIYIYTVEEKRYLSRKHGFFHYTGTIPWKRNPISVLRQKAIA